MNSTSYKTRVLAGLIVLAAAGSAFAADPADGVRTVRVRAADLNLSTEQGTSALYQRITYAARQVCAQPGSRDLAIQSRVEQCQRQAIARAVDSMNSPQLAMLHASRTNHG